MHLQLRERIAAARSAGRQRWGQYLAAVAIRFVIGLLLGFLGGAFLLISSLVTGRRGSGRQRLELLEHFRPDWILQVGTVGAVIGAILCVWTIPRWQRPWYLPEDGI
ncbi:MAG TPA: hypothetical protein PLX89_24125 [Verrucomicrobiota bacterium]|nr:hypothetical protein [Verrucomicrobiales bacterium]HRI16098.1 hypothetical protein [Verrucomicrobiota bacterium]